MIEYKLLEPTGDPQKDVPMLAGKVLPLMDGFWEKHGKGFRKAEAWDIQPVLISQLWMNRSLVIFIAEEDGRSRGFLAGARMVPLFQREAEFQVEAYYGETAEIERGLVKKLDEAFRYFPEKFLTMPVYEEPAEPEGLVLLGRRAAQVFKR